MSGKTLRNVILLAIGLVIFVPFAWLYKTSVWSDWLPKAPWTAQEPPKAIAWQMPGPLGFHIFDVINAVLLFATLVYLVRSVWVAETALSKSHNAYIQSLVDARYDAMDRLYFDLVRERRGRAHKAESDRDYSQGSSGKGEPDEVIETDPYPLMVWNFVETIVDKCENDPSGELMATWAPIISAEARLFGDWILEPKHSIYFKNDFMLLARTLVPASRALKMDEDLEGAVFLRLFRSFKTIEDVARWNETVDDLPERHQRIRSAIKKHRYPGTADESEFVALFERIYKEPNLRMIASHKWRMPEGEKTDDLNYEARRAYFFEEKYYALMKGILRHAASELAQMHQGRTPPGG